MFRYIALLRGINVGGKNRIKMSELKQMFENMGLKQVQTYIQSGNVVFVSEEGAGLRSKMEREFEQVFGFSTAIVLRTVEELEQMIKNCPFTAEAIAVAEAMSETESLYVALLGEVPQQDRVNQVTALTSESELFQMNGRDAFLLLHHSIRNSKVANSLHKLGVPMTVRNWKTINKLVELAKTMWQ